MEDLISRQAAIDAVEFGITYAKAINKSTGEVKELFKEGNKALNEAVERLKELPSAQPEPCEDTISRQAAIDALDGLCDRECEYSKKQRHVMCGACHLGSAFDVIEQLPPLQENLVNNSNHIVNYLANDTISRKAAIEAFDNLEWFHQNANKDMVSGANPEHHQAWYKEQDVYKTLEQLPSVEPEIVRCKDCKYYREYGYVNGKPKFLPKCTFNSIYVNADDFCSRAERKTDG